MVDHFSIKQYTEDQRDCLQEICNIATGQTADVLARQLNTFVKLPIPVIQIIENHHLPVSLKCFEAQSKVYAASQHFVSEEGDPQINGLALLLLSERSYNEISLPIEPENVATTVAEKICQPMIQTCLHALCDQWEITLQCEPAQFVGIEPLADICESQTKGWSKTLLIENHYRLEERPFEGDLLLLFPDQAITTMSQRLDDLLD